MPVDCKCHTGIFASQSKTVYIIAVVFGVGCQWRSQSPSSGIYHSFLPTRSLTFGDNFVLDPEKDELYGSEQALSKGRRVGKVYTHFRTIELCASLCAYGL